MKPSSILKLAFLLFFMNFITLTTNAQSSEKATDIANKVVTAMGGMENYNNTHFIKWDFGKRTLFWDKWTGDVRIEIPEDSTTILVNINTMAGKVFKNDNQIKDEDALKKQLTKGKNIWINDSYWLVMPWKLQDPGVNLKHLKTEKLPNGNMADVLQLTFNDVGVTPENKYHIFVDQTDHLIKQWAFFPNFNDAEPRFTMPWDNYQKTGDILLSFNRSKFGPKNVEVKQEMRQNLFSELRYD